MRWSIVKAEPLLPAAAGGLGEFQVYRFRLPLVADGRLAFSILLREPGRARVERFIEGIAPDTGSLQLVDNQWTCVWNVVDGRSLPAVRLLGSRFALGDQIGVRPLGSTIQLFEVRELLPLTIH